MVSSWLRQAAFFDCGAAGNQRPALDTFDHCCPSGHVRSNADLDPGNDNHARRNEGIRADADTASQYRPLR